MGPLQITTRGIIELLTREGARWAYKSSVCKVYDGIKLCDVSVRRSQSEQHCRHLVAALDLIKQGVPRHFRRIQRYCDYISNCPLAGNALGCYNRALRVCCIDMTKLDFESNEEREILYLCSVLVHEATHGRIHAHSIRYTKENRLRIERLCHHEEVRFLKAVGAPLGFGEFDDSPWQQEWAKKWPQIVKEVSERYALDLAASRKNVGNRR